METKVSLKAVILTGNSSSEYHENSPDMLAPFIIPVTLLKRTENTEANVITCPVT